MWTDDELRAFTVILLAMGETYETPVSSVRAEMFCRAVEDLPFAAVKAAAAAHLRHGKFFPRPAELRELVEGTTDDKAELAWQWVPKEVRRVGYLGTPSYPDEATKRAAEGLFGSWRALCENLPAGGPELLGFRKQFLALYGARAREAQRGELGPSRDEARGQLEDLKAQLRARGLPTGTK